MPPPLPTLPPSSLHRECCCRGSFPSSGRAQAEADVQATATSCDEEAEVLVAFGRGERPCYLDDQDEAERLCPERRPGCCCDGGGDGGGPPHRRHANHLAARCRADQHLAQSLRVRLWLWLWLCVRLRLWLRSLRAVLQAGPLQVVPRVAVRELAGSSDRQHRSLHSDTICANGWRTSVCSEENGGCVAHCSSGSHSLPIPGAHTSELFVRSPLTSSACTSASVVFAATGLGMAGSKAAVGIGQYTPRFSCNGALAVSCRLGGPAPSWQLASPSRPAAAAGGARASARSEGRQPHEYVRHAACGRG
jgi:hypothetical protein